MTQEAKAEYAARIAVVDKKTGREDSLTVVYGSDLIIDRITKRKVRGAPPLSGRETSGLVTRARRLAATRRLYEACPDEAPGIIHEVSTNLRRGRLGSTQ